MSNLANYSPYNKTYKFIVFQNQAYHEKAKRNSRPVIRTNLRYNQPSQEKMRAISSQDRSNEMFANPENSNIFKVILLEYLEYVRAILRRLPFPNSSQIRESINDDKQF
jgi:hypothetical protein